MGPCRNRRDFLRVAGASLLAPLVPSSSPLRAALTAPAGPAPSLPVSIARCTSYDREALYRQLQIMMDQLGGISKVVSGKTVAVKVNLTGSVKQPALGLPAGRTYHVHPDLVVATATLLDRAGAKRIRFLECTYQSDPFETYLKDGGWDINALGALKAKVEYEDTRNLGKGQKYHEVKVPWGGSLFPAYHLNHSYVDCDVYVSLAKLKNHGAAGVTMGIKNNFGITPPALYSHHEPNEQALSARIAVFHSGKKRPADGLPQELDPASPRRQTYRVPRHTVDVLGIRPIDLTIIDGIETVSGGEGPWLSSLAVQRPGLLLAGRNPVCTDSVGTAVMGYDPMAAASTGVFPGDNHLVMAAALGLGTNNPAEIEVRGLSIKEALHPFGWLPAERNG
jgi:uncharacterized protein (DUF362 family)